MTELSSELLEAAERLLAAHRDTGTRVALAESCTGGLVCAALTAIAGSSDVFDAGYVTYSNEAKLRMLGVDPASIERHGAVSEEVALEMAAGALGRSSADVAVSITGIAGPGGGTPAKPVGTVWFGKAASNRTQEAVKKNFSSASGRERIRTQAALAALELLLP